MDARLVGKGHLVGTARAVEVEEDIVSFETEAPLRLDDYELVWGTDERWRLRVLSIARVHGRDALVRAMRGPSR